MLLADARAARPSPRLPRRRSSGGGRRCGHARKRRGSRSVRSRSCTPSRSRAPQACCSGFSGWQGRGLTRTSGRRILLPRRVFGAAEIRAPAPGRRLMTILPWVALGDRSCSRRWPSTSSSRTNNCPVRAYRLLPLDQRLCENLPGPGSSSARRIDDRNAVDQYVGNPARIRRAGVRTSRYRRYARRSKTTTSAA